MKIINADGIFEYFNRTMQNLIDGSDYNYIKQTKEKFFANIITLRRAWPYRYDNNNSEFINLESKYMGTIYNSLSSYLKTNISVSEIIHIRLDRWGKFLKHPGLMLTKNKKKFYKMLKDKDIVLRNVVSNLDDKEIQYAFRYSKIAQLKEENELSNIISNAVALTIEQGEMGAIPSFKELLTVVKDEFFAKKSGKPKTVSIVVEKERKYDNYLINYVGQILEHQNKNKNLEIPKYDKERLNSSWWNNSEVCKQ